MVKRYIFRHIRRATAKSLLSVLLAAALIAALGQFSLSIRTNRAQVDELYDTVEVIAHVINRSGSVGTRVPYEAIKLLNDTGFASRNYCEADGPCEWTTPSSSGQQGRLHNVTSLEEYGKAKNVVFMDGYDSSIFYDSTESVCIISEDAMEQFGLKLGDEIRVTGASLDTRMKSNDPETRDGIRFTVVGSFEMGLSTLDIVVPFWTMDRQRFGMYLGDYDDSGVAKTVRFRVDNAILRDEAAYRDTPIAALTDSENTTISRLSLLILDDEVKNVIEPLSRNTALLEQTLPFVALLVLVIGAAIPGLIIVQTSKEAAIMRVLGTPRARVSAILTGEQFVLCAIGLLLGAAGLCAAHRFGEEISLIAGEMMMYVAGYLVLTLVVCYAASVATVAKKPLELLQTKE